MKLAAKTGLFMGSGSFDAATLAAEAYKTPAGFGPNIGPLAYLSYKRAEARIQVDTDAAGTVKVMAGTTELGAVNFNGSLATALEIDLNLVQGQTRLAYVVDVTTAGTGTGSITGAVDIEQPGIMDGC